MDWFVVSIIVLIMIIAAAIIFLIGQKKGLESKNYINNYWLGIGMAIGISLGLPIGVMMNNIALGPAIGLALGVGIGNGLQAKYGRRVKLSKKDKEQMWMATVAGTIILIIGIIAFGVMLYLNG